MNDSFDERFEAARELFPHAGGVVYFNSASYGPFSMPVKKAIENNIAIRVRAESDDSPDIFATLDELRSDYAGLIGASGCEVGIGMNTTFGLNIAAFGLPLEPGDEILISDVEFPALVYTWRAAAEGRKLKLRFVKSTNRRFDIANFERALTARTRVLALSFVQYFDGFKNDLAAIGEICRKNNIFFVVDGIQGMGVEAIDVKKLGIDIFCSGCQKWMLGPQGCGFFFLSDGIRDRLKIPFMSWLGADWGLDFSDLFKYDLPYFDSARRFEMGYYVSLNVFGMKAAVKIFQNLGIENIQRHNHALIDRLAESVGGNPFYTVVSSMEPKHRSSIFSFKCGPIVELHQELRENRIIVARREGATRVSVHLFNNEGDVDRLIGVLDGFASKHR